MKYAFLGAISLSLVFSVALAADPAVKVGEPLPKLDVKYDGEAPQLEGKPVLVEFWATWCPPCRTSIPHLNEVFKKNQDKGLVIIGITDEDRGVVKKFTKEVPIDYTIGYAEGDKIFKQFKVSGIPHAFLTDKTGKVIWDGHPMSLTDEIIAKAVN